MRYRTVLLAALTGLGVASCGETPPPAPSSSTGSLTAAPSAPVAPAPRPQLPAPPGGPITPPPTAAAPAAASHANLTAGLGTAVPSRPASPVPPAALAAAPPAPPADAQFTIFVYASNGVDHVEEASQLKQALIARTGRRDWYVIHGKDASN